MKLVVSLSMFCLVVMTGCHANNEPIPKTKSVESKSSIEIKKDIKTEENLALKVKENTPIKVTNCEPSYQYIDYCSDEFTKLLQAEAIKPPNFAQNKRLIITKSKMMNLSEDIFQHYLAVLDLNTNQLYPLSQVVTNYMDGDYTNNKSIPDVFVPDSEYVDSELSDSSYIADKPPVINYSVESDQICFSGSLLGYRSAYPNVTDVCYSYNEAQKDNVLIESSLPVVAAAQNQTPINTATSSRLPFTQKIMASAQADGSLNYESPINPDLYERALYFMFGGSSDSGFYILPNNGDTKVFVGYGLFEDESEEYVSNDNPDGMYVDQENYLITIYNSRLHYIDLGDEFYIGPNYKNSYRLEEGKKLPIKILANGRILEDQDK